jgi:adenine-specific DNA methylase
MDKRLDAYFDGVDPNSTVESATPWRPIHYLGSKLRILEPIRVAIDRLSDSRESVCDLFAGSGTVAAFLGASRNVIASDIQEYSRVLCSAALIPGDMTTEVRHGRFSSAFSNDFASRVEWIKPLVEYEDHALLEAKQGHPGAICDLIEHASLITEDWMSSQAGRSAQIQAVRNLGGSTPRPGTIMIRHFGGLYFSYRQAAYLDALLVTAHSSPSPLKETLLAIAVSAASDVVNTVGKQFAQPIQPRDASGNPKRHLISKIVKDRELDVAEITMKWVHRYQSLRQTTYKHEVIRCDYQDTLAAIKGRVGVIYADPPYTREHYSRFYHVLETMCLGDEPKLSMTTIRSDKPKVSRGIYRSERHQSPFCIRSKAPQAFDNLFGGVKEAGARLVLSYSPFKETGTVHPRVMTMNQLTSIAKSHFTNVEVTSAGRLSHSKLNAAHHNLEAADEAELLISCW